MLCSFHYLRRPALLALIAPVLLTAACLSSNANKGQGARSTPPKPAATTAAATAGEANGAGAAAAPTITSQPQPGANGTLMAGVITLNGSPPPQGSTLFLGLVTSSDDQNPRACIDAQRNPVNELGQFYAQVACTVQRNDQLYYVLIIGPPGDRNWHRGVLPMPQDLANFRIDAS